MPYQSASIRRIACSNSAVMAFEATEPVAADEARGLMRYIRERCADGHLSSILIRFSAGDAGEWLGDLLRAGLAGCCRVALIGGSVSSGSRMHVRSFATCEASEAWDFVRARPVVAQTRPEITLAA